MNAILQQFHSCGLQWQTTWHHVKHPQEVKATPIKHNNHADCTLAQSYRLYASLNKTPVPLYTYVFNEITIICQAAAVWCAQNSVARWRSALVNSLIWLTHRSNSGRTGRYFLRPWQRAFLFGRSSLKFLFWVSISLFCSWAWRVTSCFLYARTSSKESSPLIGTRSILGVTQSITWHGWPQISCVSLTAPWQWNNCF